MPNAALRAGDFSNARQRQRQPCRSSTTRLTGNADGTGRTPFPNNQIPANRINPIALQLLGFYPAPNVAGTGDGGLTNNYFRPEARTTDRFNYDGKVNFNRTSAHQIWGKFSYLDAVVDDRTYFLIPDPVGSGDGGVTKVYQATGGQTWTLNNSTVWDMTFGFSRQAQDVLGPDHDLGNYGLDTLHIPGTNDQGNGDERYGRRSPSSAPASRRWATTKAGCRSSATSGRTRSRPTSRRSWAVTTSAPATRPTISG